MSKPSESELSDISSKEFILGAQGYEMEISEQLERLFRELNVSEGAKILELGAETGFASSYLASKGYKTTVINFGENVVEKGKEYYEKTGFQGNFEVLDMIKISKETVGIHDVVLITETLDHYDGWEVVQVLEKMRDIAQYVIVLSQNPKCMPCLLYHKATKERGDWRSELSIFRESFTDLAELAGLELIKETYFSATSLSKWMASMVSPETGELYADSVDQNLIPEDQKHFRVLAAKRQTKEMAPKDRMALYERVHQNEVKALHDAYNFDIQAMNKRISKLEEELLSRANRIRQLELIQEYAGKIVNTPIGLLLFLYYERADLQQSFPEAVKHDYRRLLKWAQDTVNGKTGDHNTKKLFRFAEWYNAANDFKQMRNSVPENDVEHV